MNIHIQCKFIMKPVEQPLYPKLSSIYNKILQLVSAILLIVLMMSIWVSNVEKSQQTIAEHFADTARNYLKQTIVGTAVILDDLEPSMNRKSRQAILQQYINGMAKTNFVRDIHLYDAKGRLMVSSEHSDSTAMSVSKLFGVDPVHKTLDKSKQFVPFIEEIRHNKLTGYLRITFERSLLVASLEQDNQERQAIYRGLLIIAGLVGFFLTRGLNRFSRQGFRAPTTTANP